MKNFNAYNIDPKSIGTSKKVVNEGDLLKYKLSAKINQITEDMSIEEILKLTELNRADFYRIKTQNIQRFSIDRLIKILIHLGQTVNINVKNKKMAS